MSDILKESFDALLEIPLKEYPKESLEKFLEDSQFFFSKFSDEILAEIPK